MKNTIIYICVILWCVTLNAQNYTPIADVSSFKTKVSSIADKTETLSSQFIQEKHISFISEPIITKGRFLFKKENLLRWEYNDPFNYVLIINRDKILIDDEGHTNEVDMGNSEMFKQINQIMSNALVGKVLDDTDQFKNELSENRDYYKVVLIPIQNKMKAYLSEIEILFDKEKFMVYQIKMMEPSEDFTNIQFSNRKLNIPVKNTEFQLN